MKHIGDVVIRDERTGAVLAHIEYLIEYRFEMGSLWIDGIFTWDDQLAWQPVGDGSPLDRAIRATPDLMTRLHREAA